MISKEDYDCIMSLDENKAKFIESHGDQCAKTFLNMLTHVSKDQTIQYILVMIDDMLQEQRSRVQVFINYGNKRKETVWGPFLNLLNRQDGFIVNMASNIIAKMACSGSELMPKSDLNFYLQWLKDQLTSNVSLIKLNLRCTFFIHRLRDLLLKSLVLLYNTNLPKKTQYWCDSKSSHHSKF